MSCRLKENEGMHLHLRVAQAVPASGRLHMRPQMQALRLRDHPLHALQIALDLLLSPKMLMALQSAQ